MTAKPTLILGIESSCDETSAAVVADGRHVLSNIVASQDDLHAKFRGVVPEIASRAHLERINLIIDEALAAANVTLNDIDAVAAVNRPGLIGSLLIGFTAGKTIAWAANKPLIAVNHLCAHAYAAMMPVDDRPLPAVALIVSGGHTSLVYFRTPTDFEKIGQTQDDAAGEAFDKVASVLDLAYPGGPIIDRLAKTGNPRAVDFPRTWFGRESLDFSFSGLKTAVLYHVRGNHLDRPDSSHLRESQKADIAASFQAAVIDVLVKKTVRACRAKNANTVLVGGGVAANSGLRAAMAETCEKEGLRCLLADRKLCTDNAAMVAGLAATMFVPGHIDSLDLDVTST